MFLKGLATLRDQLNQKNRDFGLVKGSTSITVDENGSARLATWFSNNNPSQTIKYEVSCGFRDAFQFMDANLFWSFWNAELGPGTSESAALPNPTPIITAVKEQWNGIVDSDRKLNCFAQINMPVRAQVLLDLVAKAKLEASPKKILKMACLQRDLVFDPLDRVQLPGV
jgi:hypothetical protein